jgi:hypothetical protein
VDGDGGNDEEGERHGGGQGQAGAVSADVAADDVGGGGGAGDEGLAGEVVADVAGEIAGGGIARVRVVAQ